jgi:hypothetical protein
MEKKLIRVDTRNGSAWILPTYNVSYYTTQLAQVLWANRFTLRKKGNK